MNGTRWQPVQGQLQDAALGPLSATADTQIFHCCGNFLVRFLGTELDVMALGLKGDKAA